ncbi:MAG: hypothetical protein IKB23_07480, partial [Clostridia bacterium]|nr:hypothetical protein [Clostridia bacterium]
MRKRGKRLLSLLLAMLMIASCLPIMAIGVSAAAPTDGMTFKVDDVYKMPKIDKDIASFKAEIWIDPTKADNYRYGIMLGNYTDAGGWYYEINWEIVAGGKPKYFNEKCGNVTFDTDLREYITGSDYIEVAIVIDNANAKALLYIDGELVETKTKTDSGNAINMSVMIPAKHRDNDTITDYSLIIGGDYRSGNKQYFKGNIKSMSV